jgi:hypothetical protein
MEQSSILDKDSIDEILETAKEELIDAGKVSTILFMKFEDGEKAMIPLRVPEAQEEKIALIDAIKSKIHQIGHTVQEALMLSEVWYLDAPALERGYRLPVRENPTRKEAITIIGRDATNSRHTFVVQSFHRNDKNEVVFEPISMASYNETVTGKAKTIGLLDFLF